MAMCEIIIQKNKNPALGRVLEKNAIRKMRDSYPAGCRYVGRRARDVMPAAIRALVRTKTLARR
jgi:hypothetical protein